ncbi:MaoC/PaaZ C-terminal domain-containing protein [Parathalassolituus penaei]|uniref:MaoC/PaaZ C-terminal domain-containing protein n=1 Tax=Parathalassolituus penaei TaxID=2997323 RepID=A0A9X3EHC4_9GAMM|nr:MaoC/PaaZ C-terminal domain-containing protein [Parathalassolituus penaei]MCY0966730.1 MaoC/PaaZ C-terminal domain-containing protein [Parathalassolituus penaei]
METITNRTYDELAIGDSCERTHQIVERDLQLFAAVSGDHNPLHLNPEYAATTQFKGQIAHGMYSGALISAGLAMELPGPGTVYMGQNLAFKRPIMIGDTITVKLTVKEKIDKKGLVIFDTTLTNQSGKVVVTGEATVIAPTEKMTIDMPELPPITFG